MNENYYTVKEVADMMKVHENTIWRWIKEGKLKSFKLPSGRTRISGLELDKIVSEDNGN